MTHLISLIVLLAALTAHGVRPLETGNPRIVHKRKNEGHHAAVPKSAREEATSLHIAATHAGAFVALSTAKNATDEHEKGKLESVHEKSLVSMKHNPLPIPVSKKKEGATDEKVEKKIVVDIAAEWKDFLYGLLDADGKDGIDKEEWAKLVKGQWADLMWPELDKSEDGQVDKKEWSANWGPAITAAFKLMGATMRGEGKDKEDAISEEQIDTWTAEDYEKKFAKKELLDKDKVMDKINFEKFIYTAMTFRALDENGDGTISWAELEKHATAKEKFGPDEATFKKSFGEDEKAFGFGFGMQLDELLKYLNDKKAFGEASWLDAEATEAEWNFAYMAAAVIGVAVTGAGAMCFWQ